MGPKISFCRGGSERPTSKPPPFLEPPLTGVDTAGDVYAVSVEGSSKRLDRTQSFDLPCDDSGGGKRTGNHVGKRSHHRQKHDAGGSLEALSKSDTSVLSLSVCLSVCLSLFRLACR